MDTLKKAGKDALTYFGKGKSHERYDMDLVTKAEVHLTQFFEKTLLSHFHNKYLNGHQINSHLLVGAPDICSQIPNFLKPID